MTVDDAGRGSERIFYKAYGEPECYSFGDVDGDYDVDNDDATALATIVANSGQPYNILADLNLDGAITQGDANLHSYYLNRSGGQNVLSVDDEANDVGYAGYVWNDEGAQWHVRHCHAMSRGLLVPDLLDSFGEPCADGLQSLAKSAFRLLDSGLMPGFSKDHFSFGIEYLAISQRRPHIHKRSPLANPRLRASHLTACYPRFCVEFVRRGIACRAAR